MTCARRYAPYSRTSDVKFAFLVIFSLALGQPRAQPALRNRMREIS
jgi:hypothetical protein